MSGRSVRLPVTATAVRRAALSVRSVFALCRCSEVQGPVGIKDSTGSVMDGLNHGIQRLESK